MPSPDEIRGWIEEDRAVPWPPGKYWVVSEAGSLDVPYAEAASEHFLQGEPERKRTRDVFAGELARDPTDVHARFVALHFYHLARATAEMEESEGIPEPDFWPPKEFGKGLARIRANFRDELAPLIGLLKVEECPAGWEFIEWEVLNSCLVGDLDRVLKLLTRAGEEKLLERALALAFRGQYRFVAALEGTEELESQDWRPRLYKFPNESEQAHLVTGFRLLLLGVATRDAGPATDQARSELLLDAAHDLEKAVAAFAEVPPAYRAGLGRSYFGIGKFHDAAGEYQRLVSANLKFGDLPDLKKLVYDSLVLSLERAGDAIAARDALLREIQQHPKERGLWLRMAKLESQEAHYDEAAECVRRELEIAPEADTDWRFSTILALDKTRGTLEQLKGACPWLYEGVQGVLERFWPAFQRLHPKAAKACASGEMYAAVGRHPEVFPENFARNDAASRWIVAVEVELREVFFVRYHGVVRGDQRLLDLAKNGLEGTETGPFCKYLTWRDGERIELGTMAYVLRKSCGAGAADGIFAEFGSWLNRERTTLDFAALVTNLERINLARRTLVHWRSEPVEPEETIRLCRATLEIITAALRAGI